MTTSTLVPRATRTPAWLRATAAFGVLWNLYGICQFVGSLTPAGRSAMAAGMTAAQAQVWFALPLWMSAAFALGVFDALPGQLAILAFVVLVALALQATARAARRGALLH